MINPDFEVQRLRSELVQAGYSGRDADALADSAATEINELIMDVVSNAIDAATNHAADLEILEFIEDMAVENVGGTYQIMTRSGRTDFSIPPFPMKESLLKNPKIAEDGSRYKTIPVGGTAGTPIIKDIFTVQAAAEAKQHEVRAKLREELFGRASNFSAAQQNSLRKYIRYDQQARSKLQDLQAAGRAPIIKKPTFRTVSDKTSDDAWVRPGKELDMTGFLMDMNREIADAIEHGTLAIINAYRGDAY